MLLQRVVTALVLLPPVLATLWFGDTTLVGAVFGAVALFAVFEWGTLTGVGVADGSASRGPILVYVAVAALLMAGAIWMGGPFAWILVMGTCFWWLVMLRWIAIYPRGFGATHPPRWVKAGAGLMVVAGTIAAVTLLHGAPAPPDAPGHFGSLRLLFALALIWAADVGAYFAGRAMGRHKLAPLVSPGKTWEGVGGGLALSLVIALVAGVWLFHLTATAWLPFLLLCVAVVLFSIVGDLGESLLKRQAGAKDSGTILPGHGGMLDRVDSLLAALPALAVGLKWLHL
jgi:phosphatidate cytidylyltransferase